MLRSRNHGGLLISWHSIPEVIQVGWILAGYTSSLSEVMLTSINAPVRMGQTIVLPGDVVFASPYKTLFFPAYLVKGIVFNAEISNLRHEYGIKRLQAGDWTTGIINSRWTDQMTKEFYELRFASLIYQ